MWPEGLSLIEDHPPNAAMDVGVPGGCVPRMLATAVAWAACSAGVAARAAGGRLNLLGGSPRDGAPAAGRIGDVNPAGEHLGRHDLLEARNGG